MREMAPPLDLTGLRPAPAQTFGAFRLIPLLRDTPARTFGCRVQPSRPA